jgi:hypothetical protein
MPRVYPLWAQVTGGDMAAGSMTGGDSPAGGMTGGDQ